MKMIVWFVFVLGALSAAADVFIEKVGQKVTLECGVSSTRTLTWRRGNELLYTDERGLRRRGKTDLAMRSSTRNVNLEISDVKETDAGKFTCSADGTPQEHSLVVVSVSVSVDPSDVLQPGSKATLQCDVKGLVEGYEVKWKSPNAGSPELPQTAHLNPVTSSHDGTWQCVITYGGKQLSESRPIRVEEPLPPTKQPSKPIDNIKESAKTPCPTCADEEASPGLQGLPWWVWVSIGCGCLVVILLMACVFVLCMRVRRRRRKFLKMKMKMAQQRQRPKKYCQCDHPTAAAKPKQGRRKEKPSALPLYSI